VPTPPSSVELAEALEGQRRGMQVFARQLESYLQPGLSVVEAAAILRALYLPEVFNELVKHSGWSLEAINLDWQTLKARTAERELSCAWF